MISIKRSKRMSKAYLATLTFRSVDLQSMPGVSISSFDPFVNKCHFSPFLIRFLSLIPIILVHEFALLLPLSLDHCILLG